MRIILVCLIAIMSFCASAQTQLYRPKEAIYINNANEASMAIRNLIKEFQSSKIALDLECQKNSLYSKHFTFKVAYLGTYVHNGFVKVSTDSDGKILFIAYPTISFELLNKEIKTHTALSWSMDGLHAFADRNLSIDNLKKVYPVYNVTESSVEECIQIESFNQTQDYTFVLDMNGNIKREYNNLRFLKKDTVIQSRVFNPDPLTKLQVAYGGSYVDNNDNADPWFVNAYDTMQIMATFDTDSQKFYLENPWVIIDDFDSPFMPVVSRTDPQFIYNRNEAGFEQCNIVYHITYFHDYISSLGYDTLMDLQVQVDAQGLFGGDNSAFNRNGGSPTLNFGTGGMDDAEDADVVIHEYCHGISWSANGNTTFSAERSGLDEGLADYFATSYSRQINPFNWQKVFNWDGNNGAWQGRTATTSTLYPTTGIYKIGEVWNAAMSGIYTDLGSIITDKLMLEALHFLTNTSTLPEAAKYVLLADTLLFGGIHTTTICTRFTNQNILNTQCQFHTSVSDFERREPRVVLAHTFGFASNEAPAVLTIPSDVTKTNVTLVNIYGQVVYSSYDNTNHIIDIDPNGLLSGIYILKVSVEGNDTTFKLIKY